MPYKVLEWMGSISVALFVCHPITRKIFIPISRQGDIYAGLLLVNVPAEILASEKVLPVSANRMSVVFDVKLPP